MFVDQADDLAATVERGRRPLDLPYASPDFGAPDGAAGGDTISSLPGHGDGTTSSGFAGLWPTPHEGSPRTARTILPADPTAPRAARAFACETVAGWGLPGDASDVLVAVSELVTNALRHGMETSVNQVQSRPIQLVLLGHPRRLVITVTDPGGSRPAVARAEDAFSEDGRGLLVVAGVSDAWGWAPLSTGGKAVWAAFDLTS
ncbi:ATP-binding protein [Actinomadura rupiterrae]|uniref:ATP-binding protein n=1 Tax=Actinomadura rupiterrae TaxID=559627 RepID=UPI0020A475F8|nr:ATP-binding protein [Actinomadura rupiterrae]MCP2339519.1 anti-sigma regulatory factor (Ser/Thr protein kinase) [Actinomadura rupiterrae]